MAELEQAAADIRQAVQDDPVLRDLAKSQRALARAAALRRAQKGYDPELEEFEDEIDAQQEDDHEEFDMEADEDQDPDNPNVGSGIDDLRGVVGSPKKHRRAFKSKARRRPDLSEDEEEAAELRLLHALERLHKAEDEEADAEEAGEEDRLEEARRRREHAEHELERARRHLRHVHVALERARKNDVPEDRPAWAGDEAEFEGTRRRRQRTADEWYSDAEGAYFTNEDADHEEDAGFPPDGPDVGDGDDTDVYTIGAHKVRSARAMRRSRRAIPSKEALYKSLAADGRITEDMLDAAPALEALLEVVGDQQDVLRKSAASLTRQDRVLAQLAQTVIRQGRVLGALYKSVQAMARQPVVDPSRFGVFVFPGGKRGRELKKSRAEILTDAEQAMRQGLIDPQTYDAIGRAQSVEEILQLVPAPVQQQLGWR